MTAADPGPGPERTATDLFSATVAVLGVAGVLLPFAGGVSRSIAFRISGQIDPSLAAAVPLAQLVQAGLLAVFPVLGLLVTYLTVRLFLRLAIEDDRVRAARAAAVATIHDARASAEEAQAFARNRRTELDAIQARMAALKTADADSPSIIELLAISDRLTRDQERVDKFEVEQMALLNEKIARAEEAAQEFDQTVDNAIASAPRWLRWTYMPRLSRLTGVIGSVLFVLLVIFVPGFPFVQLNLAISWVAAVWLHRRIVQRRLPINAWSVTPLVVFTVIACTVVAGIGPLRTGPVVNATFQDTAGMPNGRYAQPAGEGPFAYLQACDEPELVASVPIAEIGYLRFTRAEPLPLVSLGSIVLGREPLSLGYWSGC